NGATGLEAVRCIYESGLSIPSDLSFVSLDDFMMDDLFQPSITSVVQPVFDMGYSAVKVLLERIATKTDKGPYRQIRLPATLAVRNSSRNLLEAKPRLL